MANPKLKIGYNDSHEDAHLQSMQRQTQSNVQQQYADRQAQINAERQQAKKDSAQYLSDAQKSKDSSTDVNKAINEKFSVKNGGSTPLASNSMPNYYGGGGASFAPSQTYLKAMEYTNQLLSQLSSGRTSYTDKLNDIMAQIEGRPDFTYDFNADPLFQQSLQSAMQSGKIAMQDTMGQAAALTGGYGSSYATSAANQAYNASIQGAYDNIADFAGLAYQQYNDETQNLYNQLGMYQSADDTEYNRLANAYSMNMQAAANMYDQEYNNFWQRQKFNEDVRQFNANQALKSANASESAPKSGSTISNADLNNIYSEIEYMVDASGPDNTQALSNRIANLANQYDLSDEELQSLVDHANVYMSTFNSRGQTKLDPNTGNYYFDNGVSKTVVQNGMANNMGQFRLVSGKAKKSDSVYEDGYGNQYTYQQLKTYGLTGRISK